MLKDDHRTVEKLFKRFEEAGDRAFVEKRNVVDRIIEELSVHAAVEEQLFYPVTRATVPAVEDVALESLEEHHIVKWVLSELEDMDPQDERFDAKVTVLIENVRHHVEEEEDEYFPEVRDELGRKALTELGDAMASAKETAPTRPHPRSPDTPPGNFVAGTAAGVVDRVGATVSGLAQGGVTAAQDLIDRILRNPQRRRPSPTGSSTARHTAQRVRAGSGETVDRLVAAVQAAESGSEDVAGAVRSGATRTGRAAASGAATVADDLRSGAAQAADAATGGARKVAGDARRGVRHTARSAKATARTTGGAARAGARKTGSAAKGTSTRRSKATAKRTSKAASKAPAKRTSAPRSKATAKRTSKAASKAPANRTTNSASKAASKAPAKRTSAPRSTAPAKASSSS